MAKAGRLRRAAGNGSGGTQPEVRVHQRARAGPTRSSDVSGSVWSMRSGGLALE